MGSWHVPSGACEWLLRCFPACLARGRDGRALEGGRNDAVSTVVAHECRRTHDMCSQDYWRAVLDVLHAHV